VRAADHLSERFNAAQYFVGRNVTLGRGDATALITDGGTFTYHELDRAVRGYAGKLIERGMRSGERVAIVLPDSPAWSIAFWGTIAAGGVAVPLNPALQIADREMILEDCVPFDLIEDPAEVLRDAEAAPRDYAETHRDGFCFILYSSGTTGEPKGVVHLQHDTWVCARTYGEQVLCTRSSDRAFSVAKLFFAYGLGNAQYFPMDVGAAAILYPERATPQAIFDQVRKHRPTLFFGVPTAYAQMLALMDEGAKADFSSVRICVSAGEALPPALFQRWQQRTGLEICDGIGTTELTHIFMANAPGSATCGASGRPVPGYDVRIVNEHGADVGDDEIGDLLVKGDSIMAFYWNKHERTKATLFGEWIRTGDKYWRDSSGVYWHAGRSDDMLKVSGMWVSPVEVENVIAEHAAVLECAVVGREDDDGLVKPHAYVVLRSPSFASSALEVELQDFVKERLSPHKYPRWVTVVQALPKTSTGKTQRFVLRKAPAEV
jgi:4-hydroxybenzoate-CoA ligase